MTYVCQETGCDVIKRNEINCIRSISIRSKYFKQICCAVSGEIACTKNGRRK